MNDHVKTAQSAARAFYEAERALEEAKGALMPYAKQQIELTKKIVIELGMKDHHDYRPFFRYDWIELEVGGYYEGDSDVPVINCQLWQRGRCGDSDSMEGEFKLSQHILDGQPERFEDELRAKLGDAAAKKRQQEREQKQRQIEELQAQLAKLQEGA